MPLRCQTLGVLSCRTSLSDLVLSILITPVADDPVDLLPTIQNPKQRVLKHLDIVIHHRFFLLEIRLLGYTNEYEKSKRISAAFPNSSPPLMSTKSRCVSLTH